MYLKNDRGSDLSADHQCRLLSIARDSIRHGLDCGSALPINLSDHPPELQARQATFVTLERDNELRGCVGSLDVTRPLLVDVSENAFAAAFRDTRFPALSLAEFNGLAVHISLLSPLQPMTFQSEADLIGQIRPGEDGLVIESGWNRGTFLPSVWESLPDPREFLSHLIRKAGLPEDFWSDEVKVFRYTVEVIS